MRLPQLQLQSICFLIETPSELIQSIGSSCLLEEKNEIQRLVGQGLPPVVSEDSLSVMFGYNPGFVWSLLNSTPRYYRYFEIPKGSKTRRICAPRVALKTIQKWLGYHWQAAWEPNENVFGFVSGRSHIDAAKKHLSAKWVYGIDIENFFPSVSSARVREALQTLGYSTEQSMHILTNLCCLKGNLVQGSPASPPLSNIVLATLDKQLAGIAAENDVIFTRYADDIVFSGTQPVSRNILEHIKSTIINDGWTVSQRKEQLFEVPNRLKVHGLLVHGEKIRLTKGYRNRLRAYQYLLDSDKIKADDLEKVRGHLNYAAYVDKSS